MKGNLHLIDRSARGLVGFFIFGFVFFNHFYANHGFIADPLLEGLIITFGGLNLISLLSGWCPVYHLAGISSRTNKK